MSEKKKQAPVDPQLIISDRMFMARVSEQAHKYDDMFGFIREVIAAKTADYTYEERNMFSVAFKNMIAADRKAVKTVQDISEFEKFQNFQPVLMTFRKKI